MEPVGITHHVPYRLLWLWRLLFCRRGWHALDEVISPGTPSLPHYLHCDACAAVVPVITVPACGCTTPAGVIHTCPERY